MDSIEQLELDVAELEKLRGLAQRSKVRSVFDEILSKWKNSLQQTEAKEDQPDKITVPNTQKSGEVRPLKKLTTYAFDESEKFVKLYYTIPGVTNTSSEQIAANFKENSFSAQCANVSGVDYEICVQGLCQAIDANKSQIKQKSGDILLVMLKKAKEGENWGSLLKLEKEKHKNKETPNMSGSGDPQESLMHLMKQMYDDGDDEMKRTIRKAWHESQTKKGEMDMDF